MKPATLDRYVFVQFLPYFAISVGLFTFIFLAEQLLEIAEYIVNYGVGPGVVGLMVVYSLPYFLEYVIPIATMIAVLLVFLGMSADNEIIALKSSGVSIYRLLGPVVGFCLGTGLLTALMTLQGLPWGQTCLEKLLYSAIRTNFEVGINEREFNTTVPGVMLYVGEMDQETRQMTDILIEDTRSAANTLTINAPTGRFDFAPADRTVALHLQNGRVNQVDLAARTAHTARFATYTVQFSLEEPGRALSGPKDEKQMYPSEMIHYLKTAPPQDRRYLAVQMEYHKKIAIPFACLALGLLAFPLGLQAASRKKSSGVGLALVCFLIYYILLSAGEAFCETGYLPPWLGIWLPNLIMLAGAIYVLFRAGRDKRPLPDTLRFWQVFRRNAQESHAR